MSTQSDKRQKSDIVEIVKRKEYAEWSSTTGSRKSEYTLSRPRRIKTLPQADWHDIDKVTAEWKATLPSLKPAEIRRFYMPHHEAILLELKEQGYNEAASYLKQLLDLDEKIERNAPGALRLKKKYLKEQKDLIECLKDGLPAFEEANRKGDSVAGATALLDTALFFQSKTWEWWWVADHLFKKALSVAELIEDDGRRTITLIRYLYGRFLFNELQDPAGALDYLNEARVMSERRTWNASKKLGQKQVTIFKECNILLHKVLLTIARECRSNDPGLSLRACNEALERATDADRDEYVAEALHELGKSYLAVDDIKSALRSFSKLLAMAKRLPDIDCICNAHMELAFAYKQLNDDAHTEKHLHLFRENAQNFGLTDKLAHAHYYIGEHYLSQGKPSLSTMHLETALNLYNRLGMSDEADRARSIAGISKGQEKIERYFHLILKCGDHDQDATLKICRWKNRRENFWIERKDDEEPDSEIVYENLKGTSSSLLSFTND